MFGITSVCSAIASPLGLVGQERYRAKDLSQVSLQSCQLDPVSFPCGSAWARDRDFTH
jgi:hypothetical protein